MDPSDFLTPRLTGKRFDGGAIPLEMLRDLATLEEMVVEVAKWAYLQKNLDRQRAPRGFADSVHFRLSRIEKGSAIPVITVEPTPGTLPDVGHSHLPYLEMARDAIINTIAAANDNSPSTELPLKYLAYFDRFGRSLREGEAIEFERPGDHAAVRLTKETRRRLLIASSVRMVTEEVTLRGAVHGADQDRLTFEMTLISGQKVPGVVPEEHMETFVEAFRLYKDGARISVSGIGKFNRQAKLQSIEVVERVSLLDDLDVPARIDELRVLADGWLDGYGVAPKESGLDWFSSAFEEFYPEELQLPFVFPTEGGGVRLEWELGPLDISFDVDLSTKEGELHSLNMDSSAEKSCVFALADAEGWKSLAKFIKNSGGVGGGT